MLRDNAKYQSSETIQTKKQKDFAAKRSPTGIRQALYKVMIEIKHDLRYYININKITIKNN